MPVDDAAATSHRSGMGAIPHEKGVAFRVWAPHADAVAVIGTFNDWRRTPTRWRAKARATGTPMCRMPGSATNTAT